MKPMEFSRQEVLAHKRLWLPYRLTIVAQLYPVPDSPVQSRFPMMISFLRIEHNLLLSGYAVDGLYS